MKQMKCAWVVLAACLLAACLADADVVQKQAALLGPVGTNHPGSGQWSPVSESG